MKTSPRVLSRSDPRYSRLSSTVFPVSFFFSRSLSVLLFAHIARCQIMGLFALSCLRVIDGPLRSSGLTKVIFRRKRRDLGRDQDEKYPIYYIFHSNYFRHFYIAWEVCFRISLSVGILLMSLRHRLRFLISVSLPDRGYFPTSFTSSRVFRSSFSSCNFI